MRFAKRQLGVVSAALLDNTRKQFRRMAYGKSRTGQYRRIYSVLRIEFQRLRVSLK